MNLRTETGQICFYQWDSGQQLTVVDGDDCRQVHFCRRGDTIALVCMIRQEGGKRVVDVPNILLQSSEPIMAYLFRSGENGTETKFAKSFPVIPRPRPADYVYTQTDVLSYGQLDARLNALEGEGLSKAVADYLTENPVEAGATAEEAAQIKQNKENIEKLTADKLDASRLPEAVNDALAQAKASGEFKGEKGEQGVQGEPGAQGPAGADGDTPVKGIDYFTETDKREIAEQAAGMVETPKMQSLTFTGAVSATYDGSSAVNVEIPSGGGDSEFTEAFRITTTEAVKTIETGIDLHDYNEMLTLCKTVSSDGATNAHFEWYTTGAGWLITSALHGTQTRVMFCHGKRIQGEQWLFESGYGLSSSSLFDTGGTTSSDRCFATTEKYTNARFVKNQLTSNWKFGAYVYADVDMASGTEAIVFVR